MLACVSWAAGSLYLKHSSSTASPAMNTALQMICGSGMLMLVALARGEFASNEWQDVSWRSLAALAYLIVFGSWVGFGAYVWLLKHTNPARVATYAYVNPVIAVLLGWVVLGEPLTMRVGWAAMVIVVGVIVVQWPRERRGAGLEGD
jgi:drug/metabolite transporter (DMT)-like permease